MKKTFLLSLLLVFLVTLAGMSHAATNAQKQLAIDKGLEWLASKQQANGSWSYSYGGTDGATGAALLAFVEQKYKPGGWKVDYTNTVMKAANYLFSTVGTYNLSAGAWFAALEAGCAAVLRHRADALVVSLGLDTYEGDPISRFALQSVDYLRLGARIARLNLPTVLILEGGYAAAELGVNAANVLDGFENA